MISVADLAADLTAFTILDVRYKLGGLPGPAEFAAGHVPGAVYVDLDRDLSAPAGKGGRHPLPDATAFASAMRNASVSNARPIVVYDDWVRSLPVASSGEWNGRALLLTAAVAE